MEFLVISFLNAQITGPSPKFLEADDLYHIRTLTNKWLAVANKSGIPGYIPEGNKNDRWVEVPNGVLNSFAYRKTKANDKPAR